MRSTENTITTTERDRVTESLALYARIGQQHVTLERLAEQAGVHPRRVECVLGQLEQRENPPVERVGGQGTLVTWRLRT